MRQILHASVPLELLPRKRSHLLASVRVGNLVRRADDGAVEGEHALTLQEVVEVEEGLARSAGGRPGEDGSEGARWYR